MHGKDLLVLGLALDVVVVGLGPRRSTAPNGPHNPGERSAIPVAVPQPAPDVGRQYAAYLKDLDEPDLRHVTTRGTVLRALWLRSFDEPVAVRIVRARDQHIVITKQGVRHDSTSLAAERWSDLQLRTAMKQFWSTSAMEPVGAIGVDGARWVLEARDGGRYHAVDWWSPRENAEGVEGGYRRLFLEILSLGTVRVAPDRIY